MAQSQPYGVSCKGGLDTNLNQFEMLATPGIATVLENFEVDSDGGYRRISGFAPFGGDDATKPNTTNDIVGLFVYADGLVACAGTNIYFTLDGETWLQINRDSVAGGGDNYSTFTGRSTLARTSQTQCTFALYEGTSTYGELIITDESAGTKPFYFKMTGSGALSGRTYFAKEITISSSTTAKTCVIHDKHLVVAGDSSTPNTIYYSGTNDIDDFTSTGSGSIALDDKVVGLKSFREDLIIFCQNSIYKLQNINNSSTIVVTPITQNVGCLANHSIQEIGGDLVFLSPDGVRTLAGTVRIGDVELGSVSRQIQSIINTIADGMDSFLISTVVLRRKSQYRLFYTTTAEGSSGAKGIIGSMTKNGFEWSETKGIQARAITSGFNSDGVEKLYHGDSDGSVYLHDSGNSFYHSGTEANILATYTTPNFDFGDHGTRKHMNYIKISVSPEGTIEPELRVRYDYEDVNVPQPADYTLSSVPLPSVFGTATFNTGVFGGTKDPTVRQSIQGTGYTTSFRIRSDDKKSAYAINGLYVDYTPVNRR
tara:strand:- start:820 stop:2436 length:1617 start_codon:yes stop_codon:yes gene_type:complete